jgi:hypothetical protein
MQTHPLDVVVLLPAFGDSLSQIFDVLIEHGLEVYPQDGQWFWRWRAYHVESAAGTGSMGAAFAAAPEFRLRMPASTLRATSN